MMEYINTITKLFKENKWSSIFIIFAIMVAYSIGKQYRQNAISEKWQENIKYGRTGEELLLVDDKYGGKGEQIGVLRRLEHPHSREHVFFHVGEHQDEDEPEHHFRPQLFGAHEEDRQW